MWIEKTYVVLGQEVEGTEDFVVIKLEALRRFQPRQVLGVRGCLGHLLHRSLRFVVPMRILGGDSRTPAASAMMVVVVRRDVGVVVWSAVAVARHVYVVLECVVNGGRPREGETGFEGWGDYEEDNKAS